MTFGLRTIRRRQRTLTRGVLALFCAAWLQAAVVPCVMAHTADGNDTDAAGPGAGHGHVGHHPQQGHEHHGTAEDHDAAGVAPPCPYCPPGAAGADSCAGHGGCAYPHDPQVDARAGGALFAAMPVSFVLPAAGAHSLATRTDAAAPPLIPRISLSVSYCRFIE